MSPITDPFGPTLQRGVGAGALGLGCSAGLPGERDRARRVDRCGKIGLYHGKMYVGAVNQGKEVVVQFDAETAEWVISDPGGVELCRRRLDQFNEGSESQETANRIILDLYII